MKQIKDYCEKADIYQIDRTLADLAMDKLVQMNSMMNRLKREDAPVQPFSMKVVDSEGKGLFFYLGSRWKSQKNEEVSFFTINTYGLGDL